MKTKILLPLIVVGFITVCRGAPADAIVSPAPGSPVAPAAPIPTKPQNPNLNYPNNPNNGYGYNNNGNGYTNGYYGKDYNTNAGGGTYQNTNSLSWTADPTNGNSNSGYKNNLPDGTPPSGSRTAPGVNSPPTARQ
jgi:hypothetical protein